MFSKMAEDDMEAGASGDAAIGESLAKVIGGEGVLRVASRAEDGYAVGDGLVGELDDLARQGDEVERGLRDRERSGYASQTKADGTKSHEVTVHASGAAGKRMCELSGIRRGASNEGEEIAMMSGQNNTGNDYVKELSGVEGQKKIAEVMKGIHIAMMSTVAMDGSISSRPMAVQDKDFDGQLWFLTRVSSEKVDELEQDQHVTLTLTDSSDGNYLTLKGRANVNQDSRKIRELWNPMYKAWFPKGETDPEIAVLRVDVREADYWEASNSGLVRSVKYLAAAMTGGKVAIGEAGHVLV